MGGAYDPDAYKACMAARSYQEFMVAHAPFTGYTSAEEYLDHINPVRNFDSLSSEGWRTPTVCLNAVDDPICVAQNVLDYGSRFESLADDSSGREVPIGVVLTSTGSHCPFFDGPALRCW